MLLATRDGRDMEVRAIEFGSSAVPAPAMSSGMRAYSGVRVNSDEILGLPVATAAIRLVAETIASLPINVYRGTGADKELATDSWQYELLTSFANIDQSPFELICDLAAGPEAFGNGYAKKIKSRTGRITELIPIDPDTVRVCRNKTTGDKQFEVWEPDKSGSWSQATHTYGMDEIFHLRGWTPRGGLEGFSPVKYHRHFFGNALALVEYLGRFLANDASVPFALGVPGTLTGTQARQILEIWEDTHGGLSNTGKPAILSNGATIEHIGMNMVDAAYIEMAKLTVQEAAMLYRVPASILGVAVERGTAMTAEQESMRLLRFGLFPRLKRFELALRTDPDLFPPDRPEYPEFDTTELLRADALSQAQAIQFLTQSGVLLKDEARAEIGLGPLPGGVGKIPLVTPVGAGANPDPLPAPPGPGADPEDRVDNT